MASNEKELPFLSTVFEMKNETDLILDLAKEVCFMHIHGTEHL